MKKIFTFLFLIPVSMAFGQVEGTWKLAPEAGALAVGPSLSDLNWYSNTAADVDTRACLFDDEYVFNADGTFQNVLQSETWLEGWQGVAEGCGAPVAPHDGAGSFTWTEDAAAGTVTVSGTGAYLGLAKVHNAGELGSPAEAVSSITYNVTLSGDGNRMTLDINFGPGFWQFILEKETGTPPPVNIEGAWVLAPQAGALAVGPSLEDLSWYQNSAEDVAIRACLFDDEYVFNADGTFSNVLQSETWLEGWQGVAEGCGAPVAPHDGSAAATWSADAAAGTVTVTGTGAYLGLSKVHNAGELGSPAEAVGAITYNMSLSPDESTLTLQINFGPGFWQFILVRPTVEATLDGAWRLIPEAGALAVGPSAADLSWYQNSAEDVETRACLFDDFYVFNEDDTFENVLQSETWLEGWQGVDEGCGAPVAPHDGTGAYTWSYDAATMKATVEGEGAFLGLAKVHNNGELASPAEVVSSITYDISFSADGETMTAQINFGPGVWQYIFVRDELPTVSLNEEELNFSVYPNPFTSNVDVRSNENMESIQVVDITGKVVTTMNTEGNFASIDLSNLTNGAYMIVITSNNSVSTKRIIKN